MIVNDGMTCTSAKKKISHDYVCMYVCYTIMTIIVRIKHFIFETIVHIVFCSLKLTILSVVISWLKESHNDILHELTFTQDFVHW